MKKFLFGLFFGGDDVASTVFGMLAARLDALRHKAKREAAQAEADQHALNQYASVREFQALRASVQAKLAELD